MKKLVYLISPNKIHNDFYNDLKKSKEGLILAEFLLSHRHHRHTARRIGDGGAYEYKEIQDNLIDEVVNSVIWKTLDGISRVKNLNYEIYDNASRKVVY